MVKFLLHTLWMICRYGGYILAAPGNVLWLIGYNFTEGTTGGSVQIIGSMPTNQAPPRMPPTAPVTANLTAVIPATP